MSRLPALTARKVLKALKKAGFEEEHQSGSHLSLYNSQTGRQTVVPMHPGDMRRPTVKEIIKQAGLSEQEFHRLL